MVAALVVDLKVGNPLINGISISLALYLVSYYILKWKFMNKVEKPTKVFTMGIGAYFLVFIMCWVLVITPFLAPPTAMFTIKPEAETRIVGQPIIFTSTSTDPDGKIVKWVWDFGDSYTSDTEEVTHTYSEANNYTVRLTVIDDHGISNSTTLTLKVVAQS
jgi:PKD repeat protein